MILGLPAGSFARRQYTARVWVVSLTGDDRNPGSERQPFRTIQRAADVVNPGDIVIVEDGAYTGTGTETKCAQNSRPVVCLTRGGTSGNLVTFKARNPHGAKLDGQNNTSTDGFVFTADANYIAIDGFEVYGMANASQSASGFELYSGGHDVTISHNDIHDIGRLCTDTTNGQVGIFVEQPRVTITGNTIHDIGRLGPGENGCVPATTYYQNLDHGIYANGARAPGASDALIANNVFYNHRHGWAIQVYPGSVARVSILNNTFAFPNPYQDGHVIFAANVSNARIANNIFYSPRKAAIKLYSGTQTHLQVANNLVFDAALVNTAPPGAIVVSNRVADPLLVNAIKPPYDFHLTPGSPAIAAGQQLQEVRVDHDGTIRANRAHDIGAYAFAERQTK
jgi:Right handed beta helix region